MNPLFVNCDMSAESDEPIVAHQEAQIPDGLVERFSGMW